MSAAVLVAASLPALAVGAVAVAILVPWARRVDRRLGAVEQRTSAGPAAEQAAAPPADPSARGLAAAARKALDADRATGQRESFLWCANHLDQMRDALVGPDVDVELSLARIAMTFREWANDPTRTP